MRCLDPDILLFLFVKLLSGDLGDGVVVRKWDLLSELASPSLHSVSVPLNFPFYFGVVWQSFIAADK